MEKLLTRAELYEMVWARPATKVAAKLGISGVALGKICRRHAVPVPARGHWAKLAAGKPVRTVRLPTVTDQRLEEIRILGSALERLPTPVRVAREKADSSLSVTGEIERALAVSTPIAGLRSHRIFLASNVLEVMLNLRQWIAEIKTDSGRSRWGKRTVTYFVFDPRSHRFAPSKYCAFVPVRHRLGQGNPALKLPPMMDVSTYTELDESESRFDGAVARRHMCQRLCFGAEKLASSSPKIIEAFDHWIRDHADSITLHPRGPILLTPAAWWA